MTIALLAGFLALSAPPIADGYRAEPKSGRGRGVLVLHAWWGLNGDVRAYCDRLAKAGFVADAPDLFGGKVVKTRPEATALVNVYDAKSAELDAKVDAAAKALDERTGGKGIAVVAFSFGCYYALRLANAEPERVRSVVLYYGTGTRNLQRSKAAYLGHFAEGDEFEPKSEVDALTKALHDADRPATLHTYPKTGHWFAEPSVEGSYDRPAAELAWTRTLAFLRKSLAPQEG